MIRSKAVWIFFALAYCLLAVEGAAAEPFTVDLASGDLLKITEKSNLRKYENGRFVGLSYREVRGVLSAGRPVEAPGAVEPLLSGRFYVFEETKHDTALVAKRIEKVVPSRLSIAPDGTYRVDEDAVYPALRSFPVFPEKEPRPGARWEAFGTRIVEPFRDEVFTRVRFYCGYEYIGTEMREGRELHVIAAQYAMRYSEGQDPRGDERISSLSGRHVVKIYYDSEARKPSFMQDIVDETYRLSDGSSLGFKGFILTWFDGVFPMDRPRVAEELRRTLADAEDVTVDERDEGVSLTLGRIHFEADRAVILPDERSRLAAVAGALAKISDRTLLVVGHAASVGRPEEELALSAERAKAVVDYLVSRGIEARRFLYEGRGSTEPISLGSDEGSRAQNRRVEIIILED